MSTAATGRTPAWKALLFFVVITLVIGAAGGLLGGTSGFEELNKPPFTPSKWVFPVVWTVLYLLMAWAAFRVWKANDIDGPRTLRLYFLQLLVNALWPFFFFRLSWRLFSFFWILLLILLVTLMLSSFRYISKPAYGATLPYLLWLLYAAYLNLGFYLLNL